MRARTRTGAVVTGATFFVLACSGATDAGFFSAGVETASSSSSGEPSSTSSGQTTSTSSSGTVSSTSSSTSTGGSGASDASSDASTRPDAAPPPAPGGGTSNLPCGTATCAIPATACCITGQVGNRTDYTTACSAMCPAPAGNATVTSIKCSGQANCGIGTQCCIQVNGAMTVATGECRAGCTNGRKQMCDPRAGVSFCPGGTTCSTRDSERYNLPATYGVCN